MRILIEIEYITPDKKMVNFHIRDNSVHEGAAAVKFFKAMATALFDSGVEIILCQLPKIKTSRFVRLFVLQCGMKKCAETSESTIYQLKRTGEF